MRRRSLLAVPLALATLGRARGTRASGGDWPTRTVRVIEPFGAGSGPDIASRAWCVAMRELTGQQFIVENRTGAGGTIGATAIARATPDGATIGVSGIGTLAIAPSLYARLAYRAAHDFTLISGLWRQPPVLLVNNDLPAQTVPELIELLRRNPGQYLYGHGGLGTSLHLAVEAFKARAGFEITQVPYAGPQMLLDLIAGRLQMVSILLSGGITGVRDGNYRALAVTSPERSPAAPELPALAEFLPGFDVTTWAAIVGPAGLPAAMVERMHALSTEAIRRPELAARYRQAGNAPWIATPAELDTYRAAQEAALAPIIRASGARIE